MPYQIDFTNYSLDDLKDMIIQTDLVPSRKLIKENIDEIFEIIKDQNLTNAQELIDRISKKDKIESFAIESGIDLKYLTILSRELRSYISKPNKIADIPFIETDIVSKLEKIKIKNSLHLFQRVLNKEERISLSKDSGLDENEVLYLTKFADLSRVRWVNHTFAFMLIECGIDTVEKMQNSDPEDMYTFVNQINKKYDFYIHKIGLNDMKLCIEASKLISLDIQY